MHNKLVEGQNLFLFRHGQTEANKKMLVCGRLDYELDLDGIKQAEALNLNLQRLDLSDLKILVSPLRRALKTAEIVFKSGDFQIVPELTEMSTGDCSHLTYDELYSQNSLYRRLGTHQTLRFPGGESLQEANQRVENFIESQLLKQKQKNVAIVSHSGTINLILQNLLHASLAYYPQFNVEHCKINHLQVIEGIWRLKALNH